MILNRVTFPYHIVLHFAIEFDCKEVLYMYDAMHFVVAFMNRYTHYILTETHTRSHLSWTILQKKNAKPHEHRQSQTHKGPSQRSLSHTHTYTNLCTYTSSIYFTIRI